jgi:hypothetical protein
MAEAAKSINPEITPEEVKEEVKEATAEVVEMGLIVRFYTLHENTLFAMAVVLVLALSCFLIGLSGNPLSYAPVPDSALQ